MSEEFILNYDAAAVVNISVKRGCTVSISLTFYDENGAVENLTGWTARMSIKDKAGGDLWLDLYTGAGITITAGSGLVEILMTAVVVRAMAGKHGVYDLLMRNSDGSEIICPMEGQITFADVVSALPPTT